MRSLEEKSLKNMISIWFKFVVISLILLAVTLFVCWQLYSGSILYFNRATTISIEVYAKARMPNFVICFPKVFTLMDYRKVRAKYAPRKTVWSISDLQKLNREAAANWTVKDWDELTVDFPDIKYACFVMTKNLDQECTLVKSTVGEGEKCFEFTSVVSVLTSHILLIAI